MKNERLIKNVIVGGLILLTLWFGLKPLLTGTAYKNYTRMNRAGLNFEENEYATIVIGSEPEGIASALACARTGLKTLLITQDTDLGSYLKRSMIPKMDPQNGVIDKKKVLLNQGIYKEIFGNFNIGFSGEDYEKTVKKLVETERSLEIIYDSFILEIDQEGDLLKGIVVQQHDGKHYYKARNFIDASQDGQLLVLGKTPYFKGSEDVGIPDFYSPLEFNFCISGVDMEALKKSQKATDFIDEFQWALITYKKISPQTKLQSPSFVSLNENELVITGLKVFNVNIEDEQDMITAYKAAEEEARMLTAFLKSALTAFKDCTYKKSPEAFFIPEYRHFEGRYQLTVSDILENKDFKDKIALCSEAVDAGKFIDKNMEYIVTKPNVYSIPLRSIIPSNFQNVMMIGAKASFTSLAATSAGSLPTRMTIGEAAGLVSAYSFMNDVLPAQFLESSDKDLKALKGYISRGGVKLMDFTENLLIPNTEQKLVDHWTYPYVKSLAEYGLIAGSEDNDFKLDYKASQELFAVLLKNTIIKMAPDYYDLPLDQVFKKHEVKEALTGETAGVIILETLSIPYEKGKALETLKQKEFLPVHLTDRLIEEEPVTMDVIYGLAVETVNKVNSLR